VIPRNRNGQHLGKTSLFQGDEQDRTLAEKQHLVVLSILHCYLWIGGKKKKKRERVHLILEGKGQNRWDRLRDSRHCHFVLAVMTCYLY